MLIILCVNKIYSFYIKIMFNKMFIFFLFRDFFVKIKASFTNQKELLSIFNKVTQL
jgi:hypothetical protein